ncbi:penicillin-binding protein 2 [Cellulomonas sp. PhB143]|uniref:peptidoglycan D,D-transpeptidase FtsI family protein n=1 Tax=Cellulomonas sp. PhB143 TaxID=2485186 RepID=UPI000FAB6816|nr:penicillin-binding protein 2 [Cellulomonas sp. PhB143]ROS77207.1 peptidoglycan synthetase FtsI [Cellulomonas sp. PhB143]
MTPPGVGTTGVRARPTRTSPALRTPPGRPRGAGGTGRPPSAGRPDKGPREPGRPERRQRWLTLLAALVVLLFGARLVYVQGIEGPALAQEALESRLVTNQTPAQRGDITDADGSVLATSVERYTVFADQELIADFRPDERHQVDGHVVEGEGAIAVARLLGPVLGMDPPELAAELVPGDPEHPNRHKVLKTGVVPEVQRAITALNIRSVVGTELTSQRYYPSGVVGGNVVGYTGQEDGSQTGQGGAERMFDDLLAGSPGKVTYERGKGGQQIPTGEEQKVDARPGDDVSLTLVSDLQWKAQDSLDAAVKKHGADYGMVVVEDIRTGALVALADSGTGDPNDRSTAAVAAGSRVVSNVFDPGSTGKVVTMAAILENGIAKADSRFEVPYAYTTPNGQTFHDSHHHDVERLTLAGILAQSSNSGTVKAGQDLPRQVRYDYLHKFGFGSPTGLGMPGESAGLLRPVDSWDGRMQYTVMFGQGVSVNAMQATSVFATIANGGVRMTPTLLAGTTAPDGTYTPAQPGKGERVVSEKTAGTVLRMMEGVVEGDDGTGGTAAIPGYLVAGKTGTAQMQGDDGRLSAIMSSFIGVAPADDPRYAVGVFLKNPKTSPYGAVVAAPVFKDVMSFTLEHTGVGPSTEPYDPIPATW